MTGEQPGRQLGRRVGGQGGRRTGDAQVADALIRVCDLAGRPRGIGFTADADGTMITSHEAVDGLARLVLHAPGGQVCLVEAAAVTPLPETGLALVATEGLDLPPLPIASAGPADPQRRVRLRLPHPAQGAVVGATAATYTATDRFHLLDAVYEIALDGADPADVSCVPPQASGAPVTDAETGAVLGVAVSALALHSGRRVGGFALPLCAPGSAPAPLAALLARNAATVPAHGPHLNLAGALQLTAASVGAAAGPASWHEPVERPEIDRAVQGFLDAPGPPPPLVLGLVGEPGSGRSTELARLAARRAHAATPAPTLWLRGADLRPGDGGLKDTVERTLRSAARIVHAATAPAAPGEPPYASADDVAGLARAAGRPLLVLLDAPEEMPPVLAHALADWCAGTAAWLRAGDVRLVVACRPEFWEQAGALFPPELLHLPCDARRPDPGAPRRELPPCLRIGDLQPLQAARARNSYALPHGSIAPADAAHPLSLRLFSEIRAALPREEGPDGGPATDAEPEPSAGVPAQAAGMAHGEGAGTGARDAVSGVGVGVGAGTGAHGTARDANSDANAGTGAWVGAGVGPASVRGGDRYADLNADLEPAAAGGGVGVRTASVPYPDREGGLNADRDADRSVHTDADRDPRSELRPGSRSGLRPGGGGRAAAPGRPEIFSAYLDLVCLRVALRLAARAEPVREGTAVRRLAARVAGQVHEAARRCLGPGQGELDREAFEELFPWRTGWASAVLTEGLLVPAGAGYRFAHEEFADWLQALHLDVDAALHALVHRWFAPPAGPAEAPVRLPSRPAVRVAAPPPVPPAPAVAPPLLPRSLPVPRHRAGAVVQALLLAPRAARTAHLERLVQILDRHTPPPTRVAPTPPPAAPPRDDLDTDTVPNSRTQRTTRLTRPTRSDVAARLGDLPGAAPPQTAPGFSAARAQPVPESLAHAADSPAGACAGPGVGQETRPGADAYRRMVGLGARRADAVWWATHLLREALLRAPDAAPYRELLRDLAGRVVVRAVESGGFSATGLGGLGGFGPWFWRALPLPLPERLELLRVLLPADPPFTRPAPASPASPRQEVARIGPGEEAAGSGDDPATGGRTGIGGRTADRNRLATGGSSGGGHRAERFLDAAAKLLAEEPAQAFPAVCGWFRDDRPLQAGGPAAGDMRSGGPPTGDSRTGGPGRITVADAAQALLHTHRGLGVDDLAEALAAAGHLCADEVLEALAEDETSAMCRAVDRWAHDPRPERRVAAAAYGLRAAAFVRSEPDRELLRYAALTLLARAGDVALHGAALGLLVRDPVTRSRHLPAALRHFTSGAADATGGLPPGALVPALATHPEPVLAAFAVLLRSADEATADAVLTELAAPADPSVACRTAALVRDHLRQRPEHAAAVARHLDLRLEQGPSARAVLLPLAAELLRDHPEPVRRVLVPVFAAPGSRLSRPLRQELLEAVLDTERDLAVLDALLAAAADGAHRRHPRLTRDLVYRLGLLMGRTPEGAARFDRGVVRLVALRPAFAAQVRTWLADGGSWDALIGPSARRRIDVVA